jgi:hypothetical protein
MDLKALLLTQGVILATCFSTFVAARQLEPEGLASSRSASSSTSSLCSRALATTLWGAAFAFFSLMADAWTASKSATWLSSGKYSLSKRLTFFFVIAPFAPLFGIAMILIQMFTTLKFRIILGRLANAELEPDTMFNKLRRVINDICAILGINQGRDFLKRIRFIATTSVLLGMSESTKLPSSHVCPEDDGLEEENTADALTLGHKTARNTCLKNLSRAGKLALLESNILPDYKQLRFVDGKSGITAIIICIQAIGYVISIVYRAIHYLPVSPVEAIGFAFSVLVIVHSLVHRLGVICQNPLVIYLNPTQEQNIFETCQSTTRRLPADSANCAHAARVGSVVVGSVVVAVTIFVEWYVLKISLFDAIGPILFLLSFITQFFSYIIFPQSEAQSSTSKILFHLGSVMISFCGIVVSIVATILNWHTNKFDIRTPSVIHNLPFLG